MGGWGVCVGGPAGWGTVRSQGFRASAASRGGLPGDAALAGPKLSLQPHPTGPGLPAWPLTTQPRHAPESTAPSLAVPQVLNVLAPVQLSKGDRSGAEQMLSSALTLGKSVGDLPTMVTASASLLRLFSDSAGDAERAASQRAFTQRKEGQLAAAVAAAAAGPHHAALLVWGSGHS